MKALVETEGVDRDKPSPVMKCHLWFLDASGRYIAKEPEGFSAPFNGRRRNMNRQIKRLVIQIAEQRGHQIEDEDVNIVY